MDKLLHTSHTVCSVHKTNKANYVLA